MKVLQINNFHYIRGGSDSMYLNTISLLKTNGHEVIHFSQKHPQNLESKYSNYFPLYEDYNKSSFLKKVASIGNFIYSRSASQNLERLILDERPDIAHLHIFYGGLTSSILTVLKKYSIPIVVTLHEYKLLCPVYTFLDGNDNICEKCAAVGNYLPCITKKCSKGSTLNSIMISTEATVRDKFFSPENYFAHIICVSKFAKEKHIQYRSSLEKKISHIYNFNDNLENREINFSKCNYLLYFGRLSHEKGILTLIQTVAAYKNVELLIVGTGPLETEIKEIITSSEISNVSLLGFKKGEELYSLIAKAMFVVVPSEWYENNPMTIIESYFLGTPVIGAKIGGISEIVEDGSTGFLFDSRDKQDLANKINIGFNLSVECYKNMCTSASQFAKLNFSSESHYKSLMQVYSSIKSI
jgi:glycosyltransferase involved in cell wall biosynthesis